MLAAMNLLGVKNPTYVTGYGGAGPIRLAYERGEVNFTQETAVGISRSVMPWVREGWTSMLYQVGFLDGKGNVVKDPVWKELGIDAPSIAEVYRTIYGRDAAGPAWEAEKALIGGYSFTRMMAVAPKLHRAGRRAAQSFPGHGPRPRLFDRMDRAKDRRRAWCPARKPAAIAASILKAPREAVKL